MNPVLDEANVSTGAAGGCECSAQLATEQPGVCPADQAELDRELLEFGFGVRDFNIIGISYPPEVQRMARRSGRPSLCGRRGALKLLFNLADNLGQNGGGAAGLAAQFAMANQMAQQMKPGPFAN